MSWIVQPFSCEEIDLDFSHVAITTQKTVGHGTRGAAWWGEEGAIPGAESLWGRQTSVGAPIGCGGAEKSQQCHKYFLQYRTYASERPQFRI